MKKTDATKKTKKAAIKKTLLTLAIAAIIAAICTIAADPRLSGFYQVPDSDVDICSKWGGLDKPVNLVTRQTFEQIEVATVISIMGEKTPLHLKNFTTTLYKFNWYIESGTATKIKITAKGKNTEKTLLETDAPAGAPMASYYAQYLEEDYNTLELAYGTERIAVPIVEVIG